MNDEVYIKRGGGSWIISVCPTEGVIPQLPFLQPGNFFAAYDGKRYCITSSTMDQWGEGDGRYYNWEYTAELV